LIALKAHNFVCQGAGKAAKSCEQGPQINFEGGVSEMKKSIWLFVVAALAVLPASVFAQATATGTIQGTVMDQSQAVIAGAEIAITKKATGEVRTTVSDNSGNFRFNLLSADTYTVKVSKPGFASKVQDVDLLVGQTATTNVTLTPGSTTEIIEVTGTAPLVDIAKTGVSQDITPTEVEQLPMVGRDVANLAYLAPGVKAADSYDPTKNRYAILSVNGAGGRNVNVTVNGVDNKDNTVGGPVMQLPLEAVQEFQISTQRFSAENGRSEGAAINMITKSGSNDYHGSVFGYFRDAALNTDEKVPNGTGGETPAHPDYSRQQFGGSIGGPFIKDKLFGFFAIERERESQGLAETGTSYSELVLAKNAGLAAQPAAVIPRPFYETRYNGRLDWTINASNTAYVSYNSQANNSLNDQSDGTGDLTNGNFTRNHMQLANFTLNSVLSSTLVNQFTAGYQYWNNLIASNISAPLVTFPNASFGTNTNVPQQSFQRKWQFRDDISKTIGKHTLRAGADYIWNPVEGGFFEFSSTLEIDFGANPSAILGDKATYPQGFATPGAVVGMTQAVGDPYFLVATKQLGLYFQDDWKVTPRLTLNLGLRWDKDYNMIGLSDIKNSRTYQELVALNSPISNPYVSKLPHDDNKDFSPRVGFAYDVTGAGKHVLRGGFGLYYGNIFQNIPLFMEQMSNPTIFQTVISLSSPTDIVTGTGIPLGNWRYGIDPMPVVPPPSTQLAPGSVGRLMDPAYRNPVTEEFNIGYSWAPNPNSVIEAEYTHVLGLHENKTINIDQKVPVDGVCCVRPLDAAFAANPGIPELASVRDEQSVGRSHYDGANFSYRQRMTHNFSINANYTLAWAYSYDGGGGSFRNYPRLATNFLAPYEWGPSPNDERHHVTVSGIVNLPWGIELAPILQFGSARPYGVTNSSNTLNTGGGTASGGAPPSNGAVVVPKNNPTDWFAFAGNNTGAQNCFYGLHGVAPDCTIAKYDPLRGDPFFELDMRLAKNFRFGERMNLQLIAQAFNLTNRANYGNDFNNDISSADTFGHPAGFINPSSTIVPLSIWGEMGVRFTF
jgi:outer membrane receptor protein involved in Fe transport